MEEEETTYDSDLRVAMRWSQQQQQQHKQPLNITGAGKKKAPAKNNRFQVAGIVDHRDTPQGRLYRVHWQGYDNPADDTYEYLRGAGKGVRQWVQEYDSRHPRPPPAPRAQGARGRVPAGGVPGVARQLVPAAGGVGAQAPPQPAPPQQQAPVVAAAPVAMVAAAPVAAAPVAVAPVAVAPAAMPAAVILNAQQVQAIGNFGIAPLASYAPQPAIAAAVAQQAAMARHAAQQAAAAHVAGIQVIPAPGRRLPAPAPAPAVAAPAAAVAVAAAPAAVAIAAAAPAPAPAPVPAPAPALAPAPVIFPPMLADAFGFQAAQMQLAAQRLQGFANPGYPGAPACIVRFTDGHRGFTVNNHPARGLLRRLRYSFFPDWTFDMVRTRSFQAAVQARANGANVPLPSYRTTDLKLAGLQLGGHVDAEITRLVTAMADADEFCTLDELLEENRALDTRMSMRNFISLEDKRRDWHPYTERVFKTLRYYNLRPVASQVLVGWSNNTYGAPVYLATAVDIVCVMENDPRPLHQNPDRYIIEVKTGFDNYLYLCSTPNPPAHMEAPFQRYYDNSLAQHFLQLCFTTRLYELTFPQHRVVESYLVHVHRHGVTTYAKDQHMYNLCSNHGLPVLFHRLAQDAHANNAQNDPRPAAVVAGAVLIQGVPLQAGAGAGGALRRLQPPPPPAAAAAAPAQQGRGGRGGGVGRGRGQGGPPAGGQGRGLAGAQGGRGRGAGGQGRGLAGAPGGVPVRGRGRGRRQNRSDHSSDVE
jgi:hypothetical protein